MAKIVISFRLYYRELNHINLAFLEEIKALDREV
jgi:hypothetical protein